MAPIKDHKTRQKEYRERHRVRLLEEDRERKRKERRNIKTNHPDIHKERKKKDAERKRISRAIARRNTQSPESHDEPETASSSQQPTPQSGPGPQSHLPHGFKHRSALSRSIKKATRSLPQSPHKRVQVIKNLFDCLNPKERKAVAGQQSVMDEVRSRKLTPACREFSQKFLERDDISYTCPGQTDTVYCGKNEAGEVYL